MSHTRSEHSFTHGRPIVLEVSETTLEKRKGNPGLVAYQFKPGNPGRPKGSRNKLGEAFIQALHEQFLEHGADVIERVIRDKPEQFLKVVAAVIPQEVHHRVEDYDELSDDDLRAEFIAAAGAIQARIDDRRGAEAKRVGKESTSQSH